MSLSEEQKLWLNEPLNRKHVQTRKQGGANLAYIPGHHSIREANRIFDFDGWSRETVYCKEVCRVERRVGKNKEDGWKVGYEARLKITIDGMVRDGTGHGSGISVDLFDAIEGAAKEAETDAMKRALMTFGDQFGLALYDKNQTNVVEPGANNKNDDVVQWKGPNSKDALTGALTDLAGELKKLTSKDTLGVLDGLMGDRKDILDQAKVDIPKWYAGIMKTKDEAALRIGSFPGDDDPFGFPPCW